VDYSLFSSEIIKQPDVCMNNTVENDFFWILVKWLHVTGEVYKSLKFSCQIFAGFNMPKIIKIGQFLRVRLIQEIKGRRFFRTRCTCICLLGSFDQCRSQKKIKS